MIFQLSCFISSDPQIHSNDSIVIHPLSRLYDAMGGRCWRSLTVNDAHRESLGIDGPREQTITRPLSHDDKRGSLLIWLDNDMSWLAPPNDKPALSKDMLSSAAINVRFVPILFKNSA
jgi:hypothetical protein